MRCGFVPLTGKFHVDTMEARPLDQLLAEAAINPEPVDSAPFWWAGTDEDNFVWATSGLTSFLAISEPDYASIRIDGTTTTFGLLDRVGHALVVARHDRLVSYGSTEPRQRLIAVLKHWIDLGMPGLSTIEVAAYPIDREITPAASDWLVRRNESQFVWSLPKPGPQPG